MKLIDLLELPPADRVVRIWRRLIPLAERDYDGFAPAVKAFFAVYEWLGEVSNGGLPQYWSNRSGDRAADLREALEGLGDAEALALFEETLRAFGGALPPADRAERAEAMQGLNAGVWDAQEPKINGAAPRILDRLADLLLRERAAFAFLDRHPGGFKALPIPAELRRRAEWNSYEIVTFAYAALSGSTSPSARDFLAVFAWADEVSCAGFEGWFFSRDADAASRVLDLLAAWKLPAAAELLRRALAAVPATAPLAERRARLAALDDAARSTLAGLGREFQAVRPDVTIALARIAEI